MSANGIVAFNCCGIELASSTSQTLQMRRRHQCASPSELTSIRKTAVCDMGDGSPCFDLAHVRTGRHSVFKDDVLEQRQDKGADGPWLALQIGPWAWLGLPIEQWW